MKPSIKRTLKIETGIKPEIFQFSIDNDLLNPPLSNLAALHDEYTLLDKKFHSNPVRHNRQNLMRDMSRWFSATFLWADTKAYLLINEIASLLHLNYFEVAYWSYLLENNNCTIMKPILSAYFTAFQTKCNLNQHIMPYEVKINVKIPNFKILYYNWQLLGDTYNEPSVKDINCRINVAIKKRTRAQNYERLVDVLIQGPSKIIKTSNSEMASKVNTMEEELKKFQLELLKGEVLSPID